MNAKASPGAGDSLPHTRAVKTNCMCGFYGAEERERRSGNQNVIFASDLFPVYPLLLSRSVSQHGDTIRSDSLLPPEEPSLCNLSYCNQVGH